METEKKLIILVDDNPANLRIGKNVLSEKYSVATAPSAEKLFVLLENNTPSMILLDVDMPVMNGYETIKILKSRPETCDIPIIFVTARTESDDELAGLSLGAIDYITKPFQPPLLLKRIELHLLLAAQREKLEKQALDLQYFNDNLRKAFSTYLSGDVVEEIIADPRHLQLGGIQRHMTVMFSDVRNFSYIAEQLGPTELVSLLNRYLSAMSDAILEQKGTIDKFEGDAIIAFFGAPLELSDHAARACSSAITMKKLEVELNRKFQEQGICPLPIYTRIGINTGDIVVGNMGTEKKMNYTVMGNDVNIASRLEGANKTYGTWILATEETIKETGNLFLARRLDRIRVVGINEPVRIYEPLDFAAGAAAEMRDKLDLFHAALELFEKRLWPQAESAFGKYLELDPDDPPALLYIDRCRQYLEFPPVDDWDGVFVLTEK